MCAVNATASKKTDHGDAAKKNKTKKKHKRKRNGDGVLHGGHVGPVEVGAAEEHVSDERLDGRLADQPDEEELFDDLRADGAQRRQPQQQFAETRRLVGVLRPAVLLQRTLRLLLQTLDVAHVRQTARVCKTTENKTTKLMRNEILLIPRTWNLAA